MDLVADIHDALAAHRGERVVVAITGPPGSGKTTIATALMSHLIESLGPAGVGYLPMDGFHLSNAVLEHLDRRSRKGAPDTFDVDGYVAMLHRLRHTEHTIYAPDFDHSFGEPIAASRTIPATARLVITEGNYLGLTHGPWAAVGPLLSRLYYVYASDETRRGRLIRRHVAAGRTPAEAAAWVHDVDDPNAQLIAGTRDRADLVIDGSCALRLPDLDEQISGRHLRHRRNRHAGNLSADR